MFWRSADGQLLRVHQHQRDSHAVWLAESNELVEASEGAWRWLQAQVFDKYGRLVDVLPAECLVTLPFSAPA